MSIKLRYLNFRYLAETARLILHYSGQEFDDARCDFNSWIAVKEISPFKTLPILTIDGKQIGQSMTINRYLAKRFNLAGKDEMEDAQINCIAEYVREMMLKAHPFVRFMNRGIGEGTKDELFSKYIPPNVEYYFPVLVTLLKQSKSDYFADSGLTWVDFFISEYVDSIHNVAPELAEKYQELLEHSKKVHSLSNLQNYLKSREKTNYLF